MEFMEFPSLPDDPNDLPPGLREHVLRQLENDKHAAVRAESMQNEIFGFFMSLDPDLLGTLQQMLSIAASSTNNTIVLSQWVGQIDTIMRLSYPALCRHCGLAKCKNSVPTADEQATPRPADSTTPSPAEIATHAAMHEYGLQLVNDKLFCRNCGMEVASLEDRMLRPTGPEGCVGCIHKTKHG